MNASKNKYWGSLSELNQEPAYSETQGREFPVPPQEQPVTDMDRRDFLKVMGASLLLASTAACRKPVEKLVPYVNKPEEVTPGVANYYASTCGECTSACGLVVKTREGRPLKLEGNPLHPVSQGGLCSRGQASILNLYDPDRLQNPTRIGDGGRQQKASWTEVDAEIKASLEKAKASGKKVYVLTGGVNSPSTLKLITDFLNVYPGAHVMFDPLFPEEVSEANLLSYGTDAIPQYKLDSAKIIVSFGADFLGNWLSPVEYSKAFAKSRDVSKGSMSQLVMIESALSLTGSNADEYYSVSAGNEVLVALALANEIIVKGRSALSDSAISSALSSYSAETVASQTGVPVAKIKELAKKLISARGHSVILGGALKTKNGLALAVIANLLNSALDNNGKNVDFSKNSPRLSSLKNVLAMLEDIKSGNVGALILNNVNPIYTAPSALNFKGLIQKVSLVVSTSNSVDETSSLAHYICPDNHYLENWNDSLAEGVYGIAQPTIRPLSDTRAFQDSLITWAGIATSWREYLQNNWQNNILKNQSWVDTLHNGFYTDAGTQQTSQNKFNTDALSVLTKISKNNTGLSVALYASLSLGDGSSANNSILQELPDPISKITWGNYIGLAPKKAKELGLTDGEYALIDTGNFSVELPVHVQPKLNENTAMIAVGYGRTGAGVVGSAVGQNAYPFQAIENNQIEWAGLTIKSIKATGVKDQISATQIHHTLDGRTIVQEATLAEYKKNPHAGEEGHHGAPVTLWPEHEYKTYRWGMAIDMNACTGCNGCMVACQVENNVPIVGRDQVIKGRDMHWLRIDRYYKGDEENPEIAFQPMLCQHCDNAPCETVCPVLATYHSEEGLNMQTYNRCVGTRYCSNNCPYKVRRFNYFDYWKDIEKPASLRLNPDITIRTRGVMEKCTFCVQRIQEGKDHAKDEGRKVHDGEIKTACEQSCPSNAIVFGDLNDLTSVVSKLKHSPRGYHVLEDLNVGPQVTYLRKIRNV